jgi:hypothetical protein
VVPPFSLGQATLEGRAEFLKAQEGVNSLENQTTSHQYANKTKTKPSGGIAGYVEQMYPALVAEMGPNQEGKFPLQKQEVGKSQGIK